MSEEAEIKTEAPTVTVEALAPEVKTPTPEEVAEANRKKLADEEKARYDARVTELKSCEGKTYKPKSPARGHENQIVTVIQYGGVASVDLNGKSDPRNVRQAHIFLCESRNPSFRWTPSATKFLEEFQEVTLEKSETINKEVL